MTKKRAVDDMLSEETLDMITEMDVPKEYVLKLYHQFGRDKEKLEKSIKKYYSSKHFTTIDEQIENLKKQIQGLKQVKKGLLKERVKNG